MCGSRARARPELRQARGRAAPGGRLVPLGPVPQRAAVGHGAGGLQRRRRGVGLPAPRPRPVPGLPVGRGRAGRVLRRRAAALPGLALWNGRDPILKERALRADRRRGQPRRGRQGVLVVPRRRAQPRLEPVALPLPAGGVPLPGPDRRRTAAGASRTRSTSCWTPGRSTTTGTGSSRCTTPRPTGRPADDGAGHQRRVRRPTRCTCCRPRGSATPGPGTPTARRTPMAATGADDGRASSTRSWASWSCSPAPAPTAPSPSCCSARTRPTSGGCTAQPGAALPQGRHQRPRRRGRADRQPRAARAPSAPSGTG